MTAEALAVDAAPRSVARPACPLCDKPAGAVVLTREETARELRARDRFFAARLDPRFSRNALRDLTDVVLGTPATILRCMDCGVLVRDEVPGEEAFRDDSYDADVLNALHETHVRAFQATESDYRPLLPPGARVLEVGSYVGGFLRTAAQWGWRATGADVGRDVVRFCHHLGLPVQALPFERSRLHSESLEALFNWNCFEQIAEPGAWLDEAYRVLRAAGLLVIRVPDADFYLRGQEQAVLAYNALLGWPHRFGYDAGTLVRLTRNHGFALVRVLRRPAMRPFRDAMHAWAREEEARVIGAVNHGWIEATFRKD